jgi:hypothetical protein
MKGRLWTPAEDAQLLRLKAERMTNRGIADAMNRPLGGIDSRLKKLRDAADPQQLFRGPTTKRPCLWCRKPFDSAGIHERVCHACKGREAWASTVHVGSVGFQRRGGKAA